MFRLVLFDLDDTLFDYQSAWNAAAKRAFAALAATRGLDQGALYEALQAQNERLWPRYGKGEISLRELRRIRFEETLRAAGAVPGRGDLEAFQTLLNEHLMSSLHPDEVVHGLVEDLTTRCRAGIVTNGGPEQHEKLRRLGLDRYFPPDAVLASEEAGVAKPDRAIYRMALERFQELPGQTLFVGDNWINDIAGPIDAGMQAVWLNRRAAAPETAHRPYAVIRRIEELSRLL
jgi:5'-nucleotidase